MPSGWQRSILLVLAILILFGACAMILLHIMPGPHSQTDYLIIGCLATFLSLLAFFLVAITTWLKRPDLFYKRRPGKRIQE